MNFFYLIGVVGNRIIGLVNTLLLTYLLVPAAFGTYVLASTNVLMTQVLLGWWLTSSAYKFLTSADQKSLNSYISSLALGALAMSVVAAITVFGVAILYGDVTLVQASLMSAWVVGLVIYDLTLAANNALGQSRPYAALSITRNCVALILSIGFVWAGFGSIGAITGQVIGAFVPLVVISSASRFWLRARIGLASVAQLREMLQFGFAGAFSLGFYTLIQGLGRNAIEARIDVAAAGQYALALDLFVAPAILLGTSFSLSRMRSLYQAGAGETMARARKETSHQFEVFALFSIPYALGGLIIAPDLIKLVLGEAMRLPVASVAAAAAVQAGFIAIINAVVAAMLVFNQRLGVAVYVSAVALANLFAIWLMAPAGLVATAWASTFTIGLGLLAGMVAGQISGCLDIRLRWLAITLLCSIGSAAACWLWFTATGLQEPISAGLVGAVAFGLLMAWAKQVHWPTVASTRGLEFLPTRVDVSVRH